MIDYFTLLNVPVTPDIDVNTLKRAYFAAQTLTHPDKAATAQERLRFMQHSADINAAYLTLKDVETRLYYLLKLRGVDVLSDAPLHPPSTQILMESMEWRETLGEITSKESLHHFTASLTTQRDISIAQCGAALLAHDIPRATTSAIRLRYISKVLQEARIKSI